MLLIKEGTNRYEQMSDEIVARLVKDATGETLKEFKSRKRPFEFRLRGSKGYKQDGRLGTVYPRGYALNVEFGVRIDNKNYKIAYAHYAEEEKSGDVVRQVLRAENGKASPKGLGLMFERMKVINIPASDWDKALYFILYFACEESPFHKKGTPGAYSFVKHEEKAKQDVARQKEMIEIQYKILNEIDIHTLKSYAQSIGVINLEYMDEDEVRMKVLQDAMRDISLFKTRLQSSTFNLSGDVYKLYENGVLKVQVLGDKEAWTYGKGEQIGEIIALLPKEATDNQLRGITSYLFDNPSTFDKLKSIYLDLGGSKSDLESAGLTLSQAQSFSKVEEFIKSQKLTHSIPKSAVYGIIDGKKEVILTEVKANNWKEVISKYLDDNPHVLAQLSE